MHPIRVVLSTHKEIDDLNILSSLYYKFMAQERFIRACAERDRTPV